MQNSVSMPYTSPQSHELDFVNAQFAILQHCAYRTTASMLLRLLLVMAISIYATNAQCLLPAKQLTWECGGLCDDYVPCLAFNSSAECSDCVVDNEAACEYWCFPEAYPDRGFWFLIPFGAEALRIPVIAEYEKDGDAFASSFPSADYVTSIGPMKIRPNRTVV